MESEPEGVAEEVALPAQVAIKRYAHYMRRLTGKTDEGESCSDGRGQSSRPADRRRTRMESGRETAVTLVLSLCGVRDLMACGVSCRDWWVVSSRLIDELCRVQRVEWVGGGAVWELMTSLAGSQRRDQNEEERTYVFSGVVCGLGREAFVFQGANG